MQTQQFKIINLNQINENFSNSEKCQQYQEIPLQRKGSIETILQNSDLESKNHLNFPLLTGIRRKNINSQNKSAINTFNRKFAEQNNGQYLKQLDKPNYFLFTCSMDHKFILTRQQILQGKWCSSCQRTFKNIKKIIQEKKGQVLQENMSKTIIIKCAQDHIFELNYKKIQTRWCKDCTRDQKKLLKKMLELENLKIEQEQKQRQNSLLKEAKRKFLLMQAHKQSQQVANSQTLLQVLQGVGKQAEKYAMNYLYRKYYKRIRKEHLDIHLPQQEPLQDNNQQFPDGGNSYSCTNSCDRVGVSGRSPSGTSQSHSNNLNGEIGLEDMLWNEWYGRFEVRRGRRSNRSRREEQETTEETQEEKTNINNCEDMVDSICCCHCFKSIVLQSQEYRELIEMFKILIIPQNYLKLLFRNFKTTNLKKAFRIAALYVHPDKNQHHNSKIAFQKLFKCFIEESNTR